MIRKMMAGAAILMMGCSTDDVTREGTSGELVAISFSCNHEETVTRAAHQGAMDIEDLYTTGFGVFASVTEDKLPNLMYNQEVEYTHVGDMENPLTGYWSYQPVKYWPTDLTHCYISAYAPYVEPAALEGLPADETGIIGISANTAMPYITYRRCENPQSCVDLLWYYESPAAIPAATANKPAGTMSMKMRHALARLEINVALAAAPASGTKVLVEQISLKGKMAKTGQLHLYEQTTATEGEEPEVVTKYYPVWSGQTYDKDAGNADTDHTIIIANDDDNAASYGIIDSPIRYIDGMPYAWQPAGLTVYDAEAENKGYQNALSTGDRPTYIYLIPQGTLSLEVKVKYHKMTSEGDDVAGEKTTTAAVTTIANPLRGNTRYMLNLKLSGV